MIDQRRDTALQLARELREYGKGSAFPATDNAAADLIDQLLRETEPCQYCGGKRVEIGHSHSTALFMDTFGKKQTLETECDPCPDYSQCCMKHIPARTAFLIHFCPMCGRKLDDADDQTEPQQPLQRCFALACRILADGTGLCPQNIFETGWGECVGEVEKCGDHDMWKCWQKFINETVEVERVCRVCGCTENNACIGKDDAKDCCSWIEEDLCSACATEPEGDATT